MPSWKKVITSGSNAELNQITASAVQLPNDSIPIASLAQDAVTVTAGDGLKNGGSVTLGSSVTLDIDVSDFAGDGLEEDGSTENLKVSAAQSGITSIKATDLYIGEDNQTGINFETEDEIHFDVDNTELLNLAGAKISGSAISTGSFGHLVIDGTGDASLFVDGNISGSITSTGSFGRVNVIDTITTNDITASNQMLVTDILTVDDAIHLPLGQSLKWDYDGKDYRLRGHSSGILAYSGSAVQHNLLDQNTGNVSLGKSIVSPTDKLTIEGSISSSGGVNFNQPPQTAVGNYNVNYGNPTSSISSLGQGTGEIIQMGHTTTVPGVIYALKDDGAWTKTDVSVEGKAINMLGVAMGTNSTTAGMLIKGFVQVSQSIQQEMGAPVYLHDFGMITGSAAAFSGSEYVRIVGYALGAGTTNGGVNIYFNPDNTFVKKS